MNFAQWIGSGQGFGGFGGPQLSDLARIRETFPCAVRTHGEQKPVEQVVTTNGVPRRRYSLEQVQQVLAGSGVWTVSALCTATGMSHPQAAHWLRVFEARGLLVRTVKGKGQGVRHSWARVR